MSRIQALGRSLVDPFLVLVGQRGTIELFVRREIRSRYVNSILGLSWAVIQPLALLTLYTFVFSSIMQVRLTGQGATANFPLYLFSGMLPWLAFADGITRASSVLLEQAPLIKKVVFPSEILPAYVVISAIVMEFVGVGVLLVGVAFFAGGLGWSLLALPLVVLLQFLFTMGIAWVLACVSVVVRDVRHMLGLALTLWMFLTPIVYPAEMVPARFRWVLAVNPLFYVVEAYREIVLAHRMPQPAHLAILAGMALVTFIAGYAAFRYSRHMFADVL